MMMMLCTSALSPRIQTRINFLPRFARSSFAPRFTTSLRDELKVFYLYQTRERRRGKEIKEQMIFDRNWMIEFGFFCSAVDGPRVSTFQCYKVFMRTISGQHLNWNCLWIQENHQSGDNWSFSRSQMKHRIVIAQLIPHDREHDS